MTIKQEQSTTKVEKLYAVIYRDKDGNEGTMAAHDGSPLVTNKEIPKEKLIELARDYSNRTPEKIFLAEFVRASEVELKDPDADKKEEARKLAESDRAAAAKAEAEKAKKSEKQAEEASE